MMMSDSRGLRAAGGAVRFVCRGGLMWRAAVSACLPACLPALTAFVNAHLAPSLCGPPASGAAENPKKKRCEGAERIRTIVSTGRASARRRGRPLGVKFAISKPHPPSARSRGTYLGKESGRATRAGLAGARGADGGEEARQLAANADCRQNDATDRQRRCCSPLRLRRRVRRNRVLAR